MRRRFVCFLLRGTARKKWNKEGNPVYRSSLSLSSCCLFSRRFVQIFKLDAHKAVAAAGPQADTGRFVEYIARNMALNEYRSNGLKMSMRSATAYIRNEMATALRKNPYQVNMLIGGYDEPADAEKEDEEEAAAPAGTSSSSSAWGATRPSKGPQLVFMDYLASAAPINYGAQGYAGYFVSSLMDRHWKPAMNLDEGKELARKCIAEIKTRLIVASPAYSVKIIDKDGIRDLDVGEVKPFGASKEEIAAAVESQKKSGEAFRAQRDAAKAAFYTSGSAGSAVGGGAGAAPAEGKMDVE